ncbi:MAG: acyltransferase [Lachnoclostridium sp.]|nr:acyltransferase [Lachnoclostridium sp.]
MQEKPRRYIWVDVLNICACAGVLLLHCTNYALWNFDGNQSADFFFSIFTHSFVLWPVDVFFMISGYTLIKRTTLPNLLRGGVVSQFYKRRCGRLLLPVIVWNVYYALMFVHHIYITGEDFPIKEFIVKFLQFEFNGFMWFFIPLIGIYLAIPYVSILCNAMPRKMLRGFIILAFCLVCIPATINIDLGVTKYSHIFLLGCEYFIFIFLGYYLGNFDISKKTRKVLYFSGVISAFVILFTEYNNYINETREILIGGYSGIFCTLTAVSMFVYVKNCNFVSSEFLDSKWPRILAKWSGLSLGIYLIQNTLLSIILKFDYIDNGFTRFIVMYPLCVLLILIMKQIPYVRKIV